MYDKALDIRYLNRVAIKLQKFERKSDGLWNTRCPICNDSKNKKKARGFFGFSKGTMFYYCHNCLVSWPFVHFLKIMDPALYQEYRFEKFRKPYEEENEPTAIVFEKPKFTKIGPFDECVMANFSDVAKGYLESRKIPESYIRTLFYTTRYASFVRAIEPEKAQGLKDDPRIIIPFYDEEGKFYGCQGRSLNPFDSLRYISISFNDDKLIYGRNTVYYDKPIYIMEGPFDSMFIYNSLAVTGSGLLSLTEKNHGCYNYIFDNQPRNLQVVKLVSQAIEKGKKVCIWPEEFQAKDINEAIISGMSQEEVQRMINISTYSGLKAYLEFTKWKKI